MAKLLTEAGNQNISRFGFHRTSQGPGHTTYQHSDIPGDSIHIYHGNHVQGGKHYILTSDTDNKEFKSEDELIGHLLSSHRTHLK